jgi:hypothetical protein
VNGPLGMLLDGGGTLADHWPDGVVLALIACLGWLIRYLIGGMDDRQKLADGRIDKNTDDIGKHEIRLTKVETVAQERERREQLDRNRS